MARHAGYSRALVRPPLPRRDRDDAAAVADRARVRAAQRLLEASALSVEEVGARCGFGGALGLRQHFGRVVGTSPTAYRRAFAAA